MAEFKFSDDFGELETALRKSANVPDDVKKNILNAMGDVSAAAISRSARAMGVYDPESNVHIADNVVKRKPKLTDSGGSIVVTFAGSRVRGEKKIRNAEIAFINEFGKRGQDARPFIKKANEKCGQAIADAGQAELDKWLDTIIK